MTSSRPSGDASVPHGTVDGYTNHDCGCDPCSAAWASYMQEYRAKNRRTINARRRANRRAKRLAHLGQSYDLDELIKDELGRTDLT